MQSEDLYAFSVARRDDRRSAPRASVCGTSKSYMDESFSCFNADFQTEDAAVLTRGFHSVSWVARSQSLATYEESVESTGGVGINGRRKQEIVDGPIPFLQVLHLIVMGQVKM